MNPIQIHARERKSYFQMTIRVASSEFGTYEVRKGTFVQTREDARHFWDSLKVLMMAEVEVDLNLGKKFET